MLINKMVLSGHFPISPSLVLNQPSFFETSLPTVRSRIANMKEGQAETYSRSWRTVFSSLQIGFFTTILSSLFANCSEMPVHEDTSDQSRGLVKRESRLMLNLLGTLDDALDEKWTSISASLLTKSWSISKARILVCWAALSEENGKDSYLDCTQDAPI